MTLEKTGDSQTVVFRDKKGSLKMRLPGDARIHDYDGRFGDNPITLNNPTNQMVFPEED